MKRMFSIRPIYCLFVVSLFALGGCQTYQSVNGESDALVVAKDAKDLLDADEGRMASAEDKELSPIEQHMLARRDVNPKKINRKNKYSKTVEDYKETEKENFRVVRVDDEVSTIDNQMKAKGLKIESDPLKKQQAAKSYVEAVLAKHQARQDGSVKPQKKPVHKKSEIAVSQSSVQDVRIGQHPGKTRIVLDVSGKTSFQTRLEDSSKSLVVTLPQAVWDTDAKTKASGGTLVKGYDASNSGSGSVLRVALGAPGKLAYQKAMKPSGDRGHRIVLDVVAQ